MLQQVSAVSQTLLARNGLTKLSFVVVVVAAAALLLVVAMAMTMMMLDKQARDSKLKLIAGVHKNLKSLETLDFNIYLQRQIQNAVSEIFQN